MHACKKAEPGIAVYGILFCVFCAILAPVNCAAQVSGITIDHINGSVNQTMVTINAAILYHLSKETRDALDHGVPLEFDIALRLKKHRKWIWDEVMIMKTLTYRIEQQPLSGYYLVTELDNRDLHQFHTLEEALEFIGTIHEYPLIGADMIAPGHRYVAQIKAELNIEALPAPLRPFAYISSQWHLTSPWQSWVMPP